MENYFQKNYEHRHVLTMDDIYHERVWSAVYDNKFDLLYLFVGKIKQIRGKKFTKIGKIFGMADMVCQDNEIDFDYED